MRYCLPLSALSWSQYSVFEGRLVMILPVRETYFVFFGYHLDKTIMRTGLDLRGKSPSVNSFVLRICLSYDWDSTWAGGGE